MEAKGFSRKLRNSSSTKVMPQISNLGKTDCVPNYLSTPLSVTIINDQTRHQLTWHTFCYLKSVTIIQVFNHFCKTKHCLLNRLIILSSDYLSMARPHKRREAWETWGVLLYGQFTEKILDIEDHNSLIYSNLLFS